MSLSPHHSVASHETKSSVEGYCTVQASVMLAVLVFECCNDRVRQLLALRFEAGQVRWDNETTICPQLLAIPAMWFGAVRAVRCRPSHLHRNPANPRLSFAAVNSRSECARIICLNLITDPRAQIRNSRDDDKNKANDFSSNTTSLELASRKHAITNPSTGHP